MDFQDACPIVEIVERGFQILFEAHDEVGVLVVPFEKFGLGALIMDNCRMSFPFNRDSVW